MNKADYLSLASLLRRHSWDFISTVAGLTCTIALLYVAGHFFLSLIR